VGVIHIAITSPALGAPIFPEGVFGTNPASRMQMKTLAERRRMPMATPLIKKRSGPKTP